MGIKDLILNRGIRFQILISFFTIILFTVVIVEVPLTYNTVETVEENTLRDLEGFADSITELVEGNLVEEFETASIIAQNPAIIDTAILGSTTDPITLWNAYEGADWGDDSDTNAQESKTEQAMDTTNDINTEVSNYFVDIIDDLNFVEVFITDNRGYVISSSANTGDFAQADESWYTNAVSNGVDVGDFEFDESSQSWSIAFSMAIESTNTTATVTNHAGVMKAQLSFEDLAGDVAGLKTGGGSSFSILFASEGEIISHPDTTLIGQNFDNFENTDSFQSLSQDGNQVSIDGELYYFKTAPVALPDSWNLDWSVGSFISESVVSDAVTENIVFGVISAIIALIIGGIGAFYFANLNTSRIRELEAVASEVAHGNLGVEIENAVYQDEISSLQNNMIEMINNLRGLLINTAQNIDTLNTSSQMLANASEETNAATEEVSSTSQSMSQAASQQAEMIAISVEEISSIGEVVNDIIQSIQQNSDIISQIALQTNILALNAGIEASRAGDYGRGFAVVAENVRRLSEESKNAAEEITTVAASIADTLRGSFDGIRIQIEEVAALSEETAASAEEVAAAAEEVTSSMEEVSTSSNELFDLVKSSNDQLSKFKF